MLKIYNTLAREKQAFVPIQPGRASMYVCGMTVYDFCHLGHARVMVVFDLVARWLRTGGYELTYVRNITDIDDKIIARALENGETIRQLTDRFIAAMNHDAAALGVLPPDFEPRATEHVAQMLEMIAMLEQQGYAYVAESRDVCYSVRKFAGYGKLSGKSLEDLRAGERVDVMAGKQDPLDFVLWKHARDDEPAEVKWTSPWGPGRPGWHIECSAMGAELLGRHFDIHGGGQDLQFPHHENEIAQSEGAHQCAFVNYWMHNGFVRVDNEKMSKSLGNFFTIRTVLERYDAEVVRFFILRAHYRSALNYSDTHLDDAKRSLDSLYFALRDVPPVAPQGDLSPRPRGLRGAVDIDWSNDFAARFAAALNEDFDSHGAIAVLFELAGEVNRQRSGELSGLLKALAGVLGLLERDPLAYLRGGVAGAGGLDEAAIAALIADRAAAKKARNFAEADRIRDELKAGGILLDDGPQGTAWRRA